MTEAWKEAALRATKQGKLGAILRCALGCDNGEVPRFTSKAIITSDGFVMAHFTDSAGRAHMGAFVGHLADLERNITNLADHLGLVGDDRAAFFAVFRQWIGINYYGRGLTL